MCTFIRVSILILLWINVTHQDCTGDTCGLGEFLDKNSPNCSCQPCPNRTFNNISVHRQLACFAFSDAPYEGCTLIREGTQKKDRKWKCPMQKIATIKPVMTSSVVTGYSEGVTSTLTQESSLNLLLVILVVVCSVMVILMVVLVVIFCKRKRNPTTDLERVTEPMVVTSI